MQSWVVPRTGVSWQILDLFTACILVSLGCCSKLPQNWWLKTVKFILVARSLNSRCFEGCTPGPPPRPPSCQKLSASVCALPLPVSGGCWLSLTCGCVTLTFALTPHCLLFSSVPALLSVSGPSLCFPYRTLATGFRAHEQSGMISSSQDP